MGLIDSVRSVREIIYSASDNSSSLDGRIITSDIFMTFDLNGNLTEKLLYEKGRLFSTYRYQYDDSRRKTGYQEYDAKDRLYISVSYVYDDRGNLKTEIFDRTQQKLYDDKRQEVDVEYFKYYQNLFTRIEYKYNLKGYVISKEYLKPDSSLAYRYEYNYGIKGYMSRIYYHNEDGKLMWYEKIENDMAGNPIEIKHFEKNRLVSTTTVDYELDSRGNWINRIETTEVPENIFGDKPEKTSVISIRDFEYY